MPSFRDNKDREWELRIDAPSIDKVREDYDPKFLLNDNDQDNTASRLANDPALLCHVIYVLCGKQRAERNVSLDEFYGEVIGSGEAIEAAGEAVAKAIANFTSPQKRKFIEAIAQKERQIESLAIEKALAKINDPSLQERILASLDNNLDEAINKALMPRSNATSSPDSSE